MINRNPNKAYTKYTGMVILLLFILFPTLAMAGSVGSNIAISSKAYDQQNPHTIYLNDPLNPDNGLWFVVWEDWRNYSTTGADIYGQFIKEDPVTKTATLCGSEMIISNGTTIQQITSGAGGVGPYSASLTYRPVTKRSLVIRAGAQTCVDNGLGWIGGSCTSGSINYSTGAITNLRFGAALAPATPISFQYTSNTNQTAPRASYRVDDGKIVVVWQDTRANYVYYNTLTNINFSTCAATLGTETSIGFNNLAKYDYSTLIPTATGPESIGTADCTTTVFSDFLSHIPIEPGSIKISIGASPLMIDDSHGKFTSLSASGTINYNNGAISVQFAAPPGTTTPAGCSPVSPPACSCTGTPSINANYKYYASAAAPTPTEVDVHDTVKSRQVPRIAYDPIGDQFWIVWKETRSVLHRFSQLCFPERVGYIADWNFDDSDFIGYVRLQGDTLAEENSLIGVTGADIIRDENTSTVRLLTSSIAPLSETYEFESFALATNPDVSCDDTSSQCLIAFEGKRMKQTLTCTCTDANGNLICDLADIVTDTLTSAPFDDGLVHIYGITDNYIPLPIEESMKLDTSTKPSHYPSVGFDPISKRFLTAWEDFRNGTNTKVYGQLVLSGGGLYNDDFIISYQDTNNDGLQDANVANSKQSKPFVSYDPVNQRFFVVWQDGRNGTLSLENLDIYGQKVDSEGTLRGNNYAIFTLAYNQYNPTVAYNDLTNEFLVVWKDARNAAKNTCGITTPTGTKPCGSDVFGQRYTLGQPSITLLNTDNTALTPPLLSNFGGGSVDVGNSATQSFKVRNTGDTTLSISYINEDLPCNDSEQIGTGDGVTIPATFTGTLTYRPLIPGTITITDGTQKCMDDVSGNFIASATCVAGPLNKINYSTGAVSVTFVSPPANGQAIMLRTFPPFSFDGLPSQLLNNDASYLNLVPSAELTLTVRFTPAQGGSFNKCFTIESDGGSPQVNLSAFSKEPNIAIASPVVPFAFADTYTGNHADQTFVVKNAGIATLTITSLNNPVTPFSIQSDGCSGQNIAPGATCNIVVRFAPTSGGTFSSSFGINSNDPDTPVMNVAISGKGVIAANITVDPLSINFGNVQLTKNKQQTVTIKNNGTADLTISSINSVAAPFSIPTNTCPISPSKLVIGASCSFIVQFAPLANGGVSSSITITSDDPAKGTVLVSLSGTGVSTPEISASPNPLIFLNTPVGSIISQDITVTNIGIVSLHITGMTNPGGVFSMTSNNCLGPLAPAATCTITIQFQPVSQGFASSLFTITSDDPVTPVLTENLQGTGSVTPKISASPSPVNFGSIFAGTTTTQTLTVTNIGTGSLSISSVTGLSSPFSITSNSCLGPILAANQSCQMSVKFAPAGTGPFTDDITIGSNDPVTPSLLVTLKGIGLAAPNITASPNPLTFPNVPVNTTQSHDITVNNTGLAPLTITGVTNPGGDFTMPANSCMGSIAAAGSCTITINFKPASIGSQTSSVTINSNDPNTPALTVNISGSGFIGPNNAKISVSPAFITFPNTTVGQTSVPKTFTVTNIGTTALVISSVTYPKTPYRVVGDTCSGKTLAASGTCSVDVVFNPSSAGYFNYYYMYFNSNDPNTPKLGVYVNGAGTR
jgi:hypothetical protein